ncbi:uncharacterized protein LOC134848043 [Symsagittifera roscoffensis]|uniref:uncharacterized protein LOC134848043 n=1 Tax=Symsagittifera roscoffensis TaxID=84072 RepID=UPI00307B3CC8
MRRVVNCVRASCLFGSSGVGELMFIHILQILSALLFSVGFFLTRPELNNLSPPSDALAHVGLKRFNKTIILVVDALRYDFLCPTPSMFCRSPSPSLHSNMHLGDEFQRAPDVPLVLQPYHNNVPFVAEALRDFPENNLLLKFIADPPTTTMQRIKGIVTGSLPTFIDMSRNFGSDRVEEDNLVSQLNSQRSDCCVFMGDDTWMGLLGDHFHVKYPYPSFNVMDLDTVDKGVVSHLIPEIQNRSSSKGWSLIVAHLLGLDHAGHRYNLNNTAIVNKLTEYNQIIKSVSEVMDSDTLLVVMGDHGMTSSGDHGGDTQAETEAALFMHSKPTSGLGSGHRRGNVRSGGRGEKAKSSTQRDHILINWELVQTKLLGANGEASPLSVSQIDLVSTLSVLMGVPIPFSNLGSVIPYLFLDNATLQQALDANIAQITRFMESEGSQFSSFSADPSALSTIEEKLLFLKEVSASYRKLWATFDMPLIILGIAAMTNACLLHVCFIHYRMKTKTTIATKSEHNLNGVCSHDYQIRSADSEKTEIFSAGKENFTRQMSFFSLTSCTITLLASILTAFHYPPYVIALVSPLVFSLLSLTKPNLFYIFHNSAEMFYILLPTLLYGLISGSNSFILNETQCLLFLSNALVIFLVVYGGRSTTFKLSTSLYSVALIAGCNFISRSFIQHPESEELNPILEPLSSLTQDVAHQRLLLTAICLVAFVLLTLKNLFRTENLNSQYFNLVSTWFTAALPVCALCIILFWLQSLQSHSVYEAQSDRIKVLFPRTVYLIVVLGFALFLCEPILVHVQRIRCSKVPQISLEQFDPETDPAKLIPQIAKTLFPSSPSASKNGSAKHNWKFKKGNARQHNGVVQQNGSLKTAHVENSEESSRSSSVSNLSKRSRNSTLTQSSAVANNAHQHSLPKQPVMGARKFFHVVGLSSTALASWHLVSKKFKGGTGKEAS